MLDHNRLFQMLELERNYTNKTYKLLSILEACANNLVCNDLALNLLHHSFLNFLIGNL
jgi:hypothetical protein